ncbi:MAG: PLP-dependent aminotransferase family protein [Anaerolineaceae bacterium]|nr:PLP-dependent aminotransferase family protein [Anaerolineaceae bacterium]
METPWHYKFSTRAQTMTSSMIRELLKLTEEPDIISFAGGLPAPEIFPIEAFQKAAQNVLANHGQKALQYGATEGIQPLRQLIAEKFCPPGMNISADNVLITSGSQQALDLLGMIFVNQGDFILVESPTYLGALQAWNPYGVQYISVESDDNGMDTSDLERCLRLGPKLIYALPNFQNPMGVTMSMERREQLIKLADQYGVPIIEDDPYGQLRFEGDHLTPLTVLDQKMRQGKDFSDGNVIYLSTFSKTLTPGLRIAWVIAPDIVIDKLVMAKQAADLHTTTFNQYIAYEVAKDGFLEKHIAKIVEVYRERRNIMLEAFDECMPQGVSWTHPDGGLFLWIKLPEYIDSIKVFKDAVEQKVAFVPGQSFYVDGTGKNTMRINFSNSTPKQIIEGVHRISNSIRKHMK